MKDKKLKIGIIGCGSIGTAIARYSASDLSDAVIVKTFFDIDKDKASALKEETFKDASIATSVEQAVKECDLIIETASKDVVPEVLENAIRLKRDIMIMSVGGLVGKGDLLDLARRKNCRVYIPSGAISGLDGIKAASLKKIDSAVLTTRKPPKGLKGAPYIEKNRIDLDSLDSEKLIFEGSAKDAIEAFPKNINVSAALSIAGIGAQRTKVRIICSPKSEKNIHEIELKGEFGSFFIKTENVPSPDNPKTSFLASLSAIATLRGIVDSVRIGT